MQHSCLRFKAVLLMYLLSLMGCWLLVREVVPEGCQEIEIDQNERRVCRCSGRRVLGRGRPAKLHDMRGYMFTNLTGIFATSASGGTKEITMVPAMLA